jgi:large subunit ribosomal protein L13
VDCGDYVIVTNGRKIVVTGRKSDQLVYRKHTMYPGGLKERPYQDVMERDPDHVSRLAFLFFSLPSADLEKIHSSR